METLLSEGGKVLLGYGILGVYAIAISFVAYKISISKDACMSDRLSDAKEIMKALADSQKANDALASAITALVSRTEARDRTNVEAISTMLLLKQEVERTRDDASANESRLDRRLDEIATTIRNRGQL